MRMEGTGWVLRGRGLSRGAGKPCFHGLGSGLRPRRAELAGLGCVPGLSRCPQAQRTAGHSGHSRVASSRPGQWGRAGGHQERSQCPPLGAVLAIPPALDMGAQHYLYVPKGPGAKVVGQQDTHSPPSPVCRVRARVRVGEKGHSMGTENPEGPGGGGLGPPPESHSTAARPRGAGSPSRTESFLCPVGPDV